MIVPWRSENPPATEMRRIRYPQIVKPIEHRTNKKTGVVAIVILYGAHHLVTQYKY